jgi:hypothetical protein
VASFISQVALAYILC